MSHISTGVTGHPLKVYNSLGRKLEAFTPIDPKVVRVYSCGPTVYNYAHIGNLRAYIFTDTLRRVLQWKGYDVVHVINITDVGHLTSDADEGDDKMELAASKAKQTIWEVAAHYTDAFKADLNHLNIQDPTLWAKATDHIQEMIAFASTLEENGVTYGLDSGLYLDTTKVADYGRLALMDHEGMMEGARVTSVEGKRNPTDFAIWRTSEEAGKRQMEWQSPWGAGAPGWHLECSVMSIKYLGRKFDIHTGGVDHRQVHHCNEIAQNQGYRGDEDSGVNYWMHNEFLVSGQDKMSKSKGGFLRLQTLVDAGFHPLVYRYFALTADYRSTLDFSWDALKAAQTGYGRLLMRVARHKEAGQWPTKWSGLLDDIRYSRGSSYTFIMGQLLDGVSETAQGWLDRLDEALSNDLNMPMVLAALSELVQQEGLEPDEMLRVLALYDLVVGLGLLSMTAEELTLRPAEAGLSDDDVNGLLQERTQARKDRDFARADAIRDQLQEAGVVIKDGPEGTAWSWK
ncbi:MAG: cysteine--tRNA ligase [Magnetococcales bacterium]|nr:cysteine--tRNA ligase [Magnetococcales bacterium]